MAWFGHSTATVVLQVSADVKKESSRCSWLNWLLLSCTHLLLLLLLHRYVHIGESHRGYLGTGSVDFAAFFRALAKYDYKEAITFESFSSAVVSGSLSNTLCVWRNL